MLAPMVRRVFWAMVTPSKGEVICRPGVLMNVGGPAVATGGAVLLVVVVGVLEIEDGGAWARVWWRQANQATRRRVRKDFILVVDYLGKEGLK